MSTDSLGDFSQEAAEVLQVLIPYYYCSLASSVVVIYDSFLCADQEYRLIWRRKFTATSIIYILNRGAYLWCSVSSLIVLFGPQTEVICQVTHHFEYAFSLLYFLVLASFSSLRVWAIWGRGWLPALVVFGLLLVPLTTNLYTDILLKFDNIIPYSVPLGGCVWDANISDSMFSGLAITTRSCVIVADAIVLLVTWIKTYDVRRTALQAGLKPKLGNLLLRDGTLYFGACLILNVLQLSFDYIGTPTNSDNPIALFNPAITAITVSRFILNLRAIEPSGGSYASNHFDSRIDRAIGNIGGYLDFNEESREGRVQSPLETLLVSSSLNV